MSYKIYGPDGEYQGEVHESSTSVEDLGNLGVLYIFGTAILMACIALSSLWDFLVNWHVHSAPLNYVAAFYYFLIYGFKSIFVFPYDVGAHLFNYFEVWGSYFTEYRNINLISIWCMKVTYVAIAVVLVWKTLLIVFRLFQFLFVRVFIFIPAIFGIISFGVLWLFEK